MHAHFALGLLAHLFLLARGGRTNVGCLCTIQRGSTLSSSPSTASHERSVFVLTHCLYEGGLVFVLALAWLRLACIFLYFTKTSRCERPQWVLRMGFVEGECIIAFRPDVVLQAP